MTLRCSFARSLVSFQMAALAAGVVLGAGAERAQAYESTAFKAQAESILKLADAQRPDAKKIEAESRKLLELGKPIVVAFASKFPECRAYLDATLAAAPKMPTMTIADIERDYHEDGLLPKAPSKCKNPKDLLVHPATAVIYSRSKLTKEATDNLKRELEEVLGHLEAVNEIL